MNNGHHNWFLWPFKRSKECKVFGRFGFQNVAAGVFLYGRFVGTKQVAVITR